jgi:hypothetical protein
MGGGAVATATGEGLPSTGVGGCNPTPRSAQQGTGGTPNLHEVRFRGVRSTRISPFQGGHLKEVSKWAGFPVVSVVFCFHGHPCFGSVVPFLPVPGFPLTNIVPVVSGFRWLRNRFKRALARFLVLSGTYPLPEY